MKKIYKKLFVIPIIVGIFFVTNYVQAEGLGFFQGPIVTSVGAQYNIVSGLNIPSEVGSFQGLRLVAIIDDNDDMGSPVHFTLVTLPAFSNPVTVSFLSPVNLEGKYLQYFLVDYNGFLGQSAATFNTSGGPQYETFFASTQWYTQSGSSGQGSVSFTGNSSASFQAGSDGNYSLGYTGELVAADVNSVGIDNIQATVAISPDPVSNPSSSSGQIIATFTGSTDVFNNDIICGGSGCVFGNTQYTGSFIPGHTYYIIFSVTPGGQTVVVPATVPGETTDGGDTGDPTTPPTPGGPNYDPNVTYPPLTNPLGMNFDIINFLDKLFTNFVKIAFPFLVIFMVYSGFLFVEARGNEEKLAHAKKNLFYVIIGALIVLGAYTLAHAIKGTVDQLSYFLSNIINLV